MIDLIGEYGASALVGVVGGILLGLAARGAADRGSRVQRARQIEDVCTGRVGILGHAQARFEGRLQVLDPIETEHVRRLRALDAAELLR